MRVGFEWHESKAVANFHAHGVSIELARTVFKDPCAIEFADERADYGEQRFMIIGMAEGSVLLSVVYSERDDQIRIISARRVTNNEQDKDFQPS